MDLPEHMCSEINFPICRVLDLEITKYASEEKSPFGFALNAPYTLAALVISILCAFRMIRHVNSLYASIGRGEMRTIFYLYIISSALQVALIGLEEHVNSIVFRFLTILQTSVQSTMFVGLIAAGFTIDRIYGIFGMKSSTFMRALSLIYFAVISSFVYLCCTVGNEMVIVMLFGINAISLLFYLLIQTSKLKKMNSDIWAYGILTIIFVVFVLSNVHTFVGAMPIAILSERNLDNLFFVTLYTLMMIMMVHKYWLNTCDFELECLSLTV